MNDTVSSQAFEDLVNEQISESDELLDILHQISKGARALEDVFPQWLQQVAGLQRNIDYETAVGIAQHSKAGEDVTHWVVGDIAVAMMENADHGEKMDLLNRYAGDTGYSQAEMREMHGTAKFWPPHVRKAIMDADQEKLLSWSHFNRARRGLELEDAADAIELAYQRNWSVAQLEAHIQDEHAKKTPEDKRRNKIKMAVHALGMLSGIGLPEDIVNDAKNLRHRLEDIL